MSRGGRAIAQIHLRKYSTAAGLGCFLLFLTPFFLAGGWVLIDGLRALSRGEGYTEDTIAKLGVGALFLTISSGFLLAVLGGFRRLRQIEARKAEHPHEPWRWRDEWTDGVILSHGGGALVPLWLIGAVFTSVGGFALWQGEELRSEGIVPLLIVMIFPLVGLLLLAFAVYKTVAYVKYGRSTCELVTHPGVIGGWFKAAVRARVSIATGDTATARLTCIHQYTTGSGKNRSTRRDVLWQDEKTIDHAGIGVDRDGASTFPVVFYVPRECRPAEGEGSDRILWELNLKCSVPGVDFDQSWEVPVFVTGESADTPPDDYAQKLETDFEAKDYIRTSKIHVTPLPDGMTLYAPPARAKGAAFGLSLFTAVWLAITVGISFAGAPFFFPLIFGFFGLFMLYAALDLWFGAVRTEIRANAIDIRSTWLGLGRTRSFAVEEIDSVQLSKGMTAGDTSYYRVKLRTNAGKSAIVADYIRDRGEALWLQKLVSDRFGVPTEETTPRLRRRSPNG